MKSNVDLRNFFLILSIIPLGLIKAITRKFACIYSRAWVKVLYKLVHTSPYLSTSVLH